MKSLLYCITIFLLISCNNKTSKNEEQSNKNNTAEVVEKDNGKKKIYLTFDDGPTVGSKKLYQLIKQEQLPTTLYLVGEHYNAMPGLHKELDSVRYLPYVVLANHSFSHAWHDKYKAFYNNPPAVIEDYKKAQGILNITSGIARCAGRNAWRTAKLNITDSANGPSTAMDMLYKQGYQFTGWDRTWPYDYKTFKNKKDAAGMMTLVRLYFDSSYTKSPNHIVLLCHDQQFAKDEEFNQLKDFIDSIKSSKIYEFKTMATYPGIVKPK